MLREIDGMLAHRLRSGLGKRELLKLASEVWNAAVITSAPADCKAAGAPEREVVVFVSSFTHSPDGMGSASLCTKVDVPPWACRKTG
jgi:hypothetical protein